MRGHARNADALEQHVAHDAPVELTRYVDLLRAADQAAAQRARYTFKLEYPDGRWDVAEQELAAKPRAGDLVWFGGSAWQVVGRSQVIPRPSSKPPHEFLACAPVAA